MKSISRRQFVKAGLLLGGALSFPIHAISFGKNREGSGPGINASGQLIHGPFKPLPLGSVKADAWLEHQLWLQAKGLTGRMENYPDYSPKSAWLGGDGESWENGPYYVRGLVALAYALNNAELKTKAQKWIDWSIDNQRADGYFGPVRNDSWWSRMPMMMAIRDYYEASGKQDARVLPFFEKYFRYQEQELPKRRLSNWADARGADNIDSVLWYYREVIANGTSEKDAAWLIDLARLLQSQTQNWSDTFNHSTVRYHVVNTSQALKYAPVVHQYTKERSDRVAFERAIFNWSIDHGRIDKLPNADEAARDNQSTRGTETCGVVEAMLSTEIAIRDYGDAQLGDFLEHLAYNALPLTTTPDFSGHTYYALQNQVMATLGNHGFDCDHGDSCAFGAPLGFDCCFANHHMGWGKYVQHMWMATTDGGLAAVAYGPNHVAATVAEGKTASFRQETDYPFKDTVKMVYEGEAARFPLDLRIPEWAVDATVKINGQEESKVMKGSFHRINREFKKGDVIELVFPSKIIASRWYNDSVAVEKGALIYALGVREDWRLYDSNDARELKVPHQEEQPLREIYPASRWNYGLIVDESAPEKSFEVLNNPIALQPFSHVTAPVVLKARGQVLPEWTLEGNKSAPQPLGAVAYDESKTETIHLVPYGCSRLKIAHFPRIGNPDDFMLRSASTKKVFKQHGKTVTEFANVIVAPATEYKMDVSCSGKGLCQLFVNGKDCGSIEFEGNPVTVPGLRGCIESESFKFKEQQYNNIRFVGDGSISISQIKIIPSEVVSEPKITEITGGKDFVTVTTNLPRSVATYRVLYGTQKGKYTYAASGFEGNIAGITGLREKTTYYFAVSAVVNGRSMMSNEYAFTVGSYVTVKDAEIRFSDDFSSFSSIDAHWQKFGEAEKINIQQGRLVFEKSDNVKILAGDDGWKNYACEASIDIMEEGGTDAGIMVRVTDAGSGADTYKGIYFGISAKNYTIGESSNGWNELARANYKLGTNKNCRLTVAVREDRYAFYIDGKLVHTLSNGKYPNGRIGLRSYRQPFAASNVVVRPLNQEEIKTLSASQSAESGERKRSSEKPDISVVSAFESIQVKYSRVAGADGYKIEYGTESGKYTQAVYGVKWNGYKGGRIFTADKWAIGNLENGKTYFLRIIPLSGNMELTPSDEVSVTIGYRGKTNKEKLNAVYSEAKRQGATISGLGDSEAVKFAAQVLADANANQMTVDMARANLIVRMVQGLAYKKSPENAGNIKKQ